MALLLVSQWTEKGIQNRHIMEDKNGRSKILESLSNDVKSCMCNHINQYVESKYSFLEQCMFCKYKGIFIYSSV